MEQNKSVNKKPSKYSLLSEEEKEIRREYDRNYYKLNKERRKELIKKSTNKKKDYYREKQKQWAIANREKMTQYKRNERKRTENLILNLFTIICYYEKSLNEYHEITS